MSIFCFLDMSEVLTIEGIQYVTATHAGNHFGYTKDYLSMLINAGKIEGHKVGRKWYVNFNSAEIFFKTAHEQRTAYRKHISAERKKELHHHTQVRTAHRPQNAILETLVILIIGLSLGVAGYLGTVSQSASVSQGDFNFLKNLAVSLYTLVSPVDTLSITDEEISSSVGSKSNLAENTPAVNTQKQDSTPADALIVAPAKTFTEASLASVAESFSDDVEVTHDPKNPKTGIVTPIFKESKGEPYRFLLVPVMQEVNN